MGQRYRYEGPPGCCRPTRTWRKWLIAYEDGEEIYAKKGYILDLGKLSIRRGQNIHVYEETITHIINHRTCEIEVDKFRVEITERLKMEIKIENLDRKLLKEKRI